MYEASQAIAKIQIDLDAEIRKINPQNLIKSMWILNGNQRKLKDQRNEKM